MSKYFTYLIVSLMTALLCATAGSAAEFEVAEGTVIELGAKAKLLGTFDDEGNSFALDDARIKVGASKGIFSGAIQLDYSDSEVFLKDGYVVGAFSDLANVKAGRFKMPTDRNTQMSSYSSVTWLKNKISSKWESPQQGNRGDGVAVSGSVTPTAGLDAAYNVGVFDGNDGGAIFAVRGSASYDKAPGLNVGLTFQGQNDAFVGGQDFIGFGIDAQYALSIKEGDLLVDAGFNTYDLDGAAYTPGTGLNAGEGYYVSTSFVVNDGKFDALPGLSITPQPFFKYQNFAYDDGVSGSHDRFDLGVNLLADVFESTKLTINYFHDTPVDGISNDGVFLGLKTVF